ncbi:MAG TPA: fumarylacetoacetate hydrolase family protein [Bryobacteraceae bacterium]|jgi:2-keto-4-pentenoate hydratase/2-oxohepta-3-ene-1,7-dioic acid hydratase in catechol pathway|nr:fumarylacetoacetate hydrolase family protein [Bryobacteraceae bacterium]
MRFCRFGDQRLGLVEGDTVRDVTAALEVLPCCYSYPLPTHDVLIANLDQVAERARALAPTAPSLPLAGLKLLSPVANPGKIVAAPVNYQKHAQEVKDNVALHNNNPALMQSIHTIGLFLKATSSLTGPGDGIRLRKPDRRNDHEVELAFVIGKQASNIPRSEALGYVAGYSIGLDITIRGTEDRSFRKSPDSYSVLGPWLVTRDEIDNPGNLDLGISVNGEVRQKSNTNNMILGVAELIELASSFYTLYPGDIFMTGTPEGVSQIVPGDVVVATVEKVGTMQVVVRTEQSAVTEPPPKEAVIG